jgi:hypothetical protein
MHAVGKGAEYIILTDGQIGRIWPLTAPSGQPAQRPPAMAAARDGLAGGHVSHRAGAKSARRLAVHLQPAAAE